jgi:hypothetical protein
MCVCVCVCFQRASSVSVFDGLRRERERAKGSLCEEEEIRVHVPMMGSCSYVEELGILHASTAIWFVVSKIWTRWYLTWASNFFNRPFGI